MAAPARKRATYEDVLRAPENMVAQLVDGQLDLQPRPRALHARCASVLGGLLDPPLGWGDGGGPGGWVILDEPEIHFGEHVLVPDLTGWRRERMPELPDVVFFELAPDWVCEVLSPSTAGFDRVKKLPIYAEHGVSHAWLVDPAEQTLEVLELTASRWTLVGAYQGDAQVRAVPFAMVELPLARPWVR
jgi:Uma2 family endonuclease